VVCSCAALRSCVLCLAVGLLGIGAGWGAFIVHVCIQSQQQEQQQQQLFTHLETGKWQVNAAFIYLDLLSTHHTIPTDPPFLHNLSPLHGVFVTRGFS
jgi:hypothetical protein